MRRHLEEKSKGLTDMNSQKVLYFGDHIFSDLVDASIQHSWHTVSIIYKRISLISTYGINFFFVLGSYHS